MSQAACPRRRAQGYSMMPSRGLEPPLAGGGREEA